MKRIATLVFLLLIPVVYATSKTNNDVNFYTANVEQLYVLVAKNFIESEKIATRACDTLLKLESLCKYEHAYDLLKSSASLIKKFPVLKVKLDTLLEILTQNKEFFEILFQSKSAESKDAFVKIFDKYYKITSDIQVENKSLNNTIANKQSENDDLNKKMKKDYFPTGNALKVEIGLILIASLLSFLFAWLLFVWWIKKKIFDGEEKKYRKTVGSEYLSKIIKWLKNRQIDHVQAVSNGNTESPNNSKQHSDFSNEAYYRQQFFKLENEIKRLENEKSSLELSLHTIERKLYECENSTRTIPTIIEPVGMPEDLISEPQKLITVQPSIETYYFSIPESDGSFDLDKSRSKGSDTFYKIEVDQSGSTGKLYYISSEFDRSAINNVDAYLKPACNIENIIDRPYAQGIKVLSPGKVSKYNNKWKIEIPVMIEFIK